MRRKARPCGNAYGQPPSPLLPVSYSFPPSLLFLRFLYPVTRRPPLLTFFRRPIHFPFRPRSLFQVRSLPSPVPPRARTDGTPSGRLTQLPPTPATRFYLFSWAWAFLFFVFTHTALCGSPPKWEIRCPCLFFFHAPNRKNPGFTLPLEVAAFTLFFPRGDDLEAWCFSRGASLSRGLSLFPPILSLSEFKTLRTGASRPQVSASSFCLIKSGGFFRCSLPIIAAFTLSLPKRA